MASYRRLARHERYQIEVLLRRGDRIREIARILKRSPSTISRELKRNRDALTPGFYWADPAHDRTIAVRQHPKLQLRRIEPQSELKSYVHEKMLLDWSPEQIAGRLKREKERSVLSYSTIYRYIYRDYLLGGILWKHMRKPRRRRRTMRLLKYRPNQGQISNRVFIEHRPKVIELRQRKGDYERDTIRGTRVEPVILSIVDRKSKLSYLKFLPKKTASGVHETTVSTLSQDPHLHSITNDNGKEFSWHEQTQQALQKPIYFSHPYCSWERGTNENTNGLVRQYFPKGSDFSRITAEQVEAVQNLLNQRPRKCLGYKTPLEVHHRS